MENTSKLSPVSDRDFFYYRQRSKNRLFEAITAFFAEEVERRDLTKKDIAECLKRDPSQVTRWLGGPSNLTQDTVSDLLLCLGAEMDYSVVRFADRPISNEMHPLMSKLLHPTSIDVKYNREEHLGAAPYQRVENAKTATEAVTVATTE